MGLRLQINLIITALLGVFASLVIGLEIDSTRRGVHEEVMGANVVATQLLSRADWVYGVGGMEGLASYLNRVGRVRANDISLYDDQNNLLYQSPAPTYKVGREAPQWYTRLVASPLAPKVIALPKGRIVLQADASRATLDGWDDLRPMLWIVFGGFVLANLLVYAVVGRALKPVRLLIGGLDQVARGAYDARLPALAGHEGRQIRAAFNGMAQSVQDSVLARAQAQEATQALAVNRELTQLIQTRIEQERSAIARELHDEMGQQVTAIKSVGLAIARKAAGHDAMIEQSARLVMGCADQIYDSVHRLIAKLRPLALDRFGLRDALQDLLDDHRAHHGEVAMNLTTRGDLERLDDDLATAAYRIVQEALTNALRHAHASRVHVTLQATAQGLELQVQDDGTGRLAQFQSAGHYGLLGMRERAQALGGQFELEQAEPAGVRVRVNWPSAQPLVKPHKE